jgi:hypothetical protein
VYASARHDASPGARNREDPTRPGLRPREEARRQGVAHPADGGRGGPRAHLGRRHGTGPADGGVPALARSPRAQSDCHLRQEQRVVVAVRPRDLDGRARLGPAVPHADRRDDRTDPRPQRISPDLHRQARRVRRDGARDPQGSGPGGASPGSQDRGGHLGRAPREARAHRGQPQSRSRSARDPHLHLGQHGGSQGGHAQLPHDVRPPRAS